MTIGPDWPDRLYATLKRAGVRQVGYVPDAGHSRLIERCRADTDIHDVALTTEEEGVALCAGAWLGGDRSALLMQSSGLGNCINMLSLARSCRFPLLMLITMRGEVGGVQSLAGTDGFDRRSGARAVRGGGLSRLET